MELPIFGGAARAVQGRCSHKLVDILMLILCKLLADCEDFEEIQDFGNDQPEFLKTFLELPNGIPSHDTMDRLMRHLNADQLADSLAKWGRELVTQLAQKQVGVDGKEIRGTIAKGRTGAHTWRDQP